MPILPMRTLFALTSIGHKFIFQIVYRSREPFPSTYAHARSSSLSPPPFIRLLAHHGYYEEAPLFYFSPENPPILSDSWRRLCPFACARRNTFHAETVRLPFALLSALLIRSCDHPASSFWPQTYLHAQCQSTSLPSVRLAGET